MNRALLAAVLAAAWVGGASAEPPAVQLPRETQTYRRGKGAELADARCLACHSADYSAMQPPMPRAFWKSVVEKMREKYGAEIPDGEVEALADYLAAAYGTGTAAGARAAAPSAPRTHQPPELAYHYGCFSCHDLAVKKVGPAFADVAAKYRGDSRGRARVARQIRKGGGGRWGPKPMPSFPQIAGPDVEALADWILRQ